MIPHRAPGSRSPNTATLPGAVFAKLDPHNEAAAPVRLAPIRVALATVAILLVELAGVTAGSAMAPWLDGTAAAQDAGDHTPPTRHGSTHGDPPVPVWARGAVWYQIFPERFENGDPSNDPTAEMIGAPEGWAITPWTSDWFARAPWERRMGDEFASSLFTRRYGGDLQGVLDRLDHLDRLGVQVLYFNPVFHARSLHKYDGASFHHIDPTFGPDPAGDLALMAAEDPADPATWRWTAADRLFLRLVREAHARGIRVVIDGVFNHTGPEFWAFRDLVERQTDSPYRDWYSVLSFDDPATPDRNEFDYQGWWGYKGLPEFRETPDGRYPASLEGYIEAATRRWMAPDGQPEHGIDGWRLDVADQVDPAFWRWWHSVVRSVNPQAITVAEVWTDDAEHMVSAEGFTSVMNYRFVYALKEHFIDGTLPSESLMERLTRLGRPWGPDVELGLLNLLDSHDTPRIANMILNPGLGYDRQAKPEDGYVFRAPTPDERRLQFAMHLFQVAWPGSPMIYYGTETGMWGADDPHDRKPMVWPDRTHDVEAADPYNRGYAPQPVRADTAMTGWFRDMFALRTDHPWLRTTPASPLSTGEPDVSAFGRGEEGVFVFNRAPENRRADLPLPCGDAPGDWTVTYDLTRDLARRSLLDASGPTRATLHRLDANRCTVDLPPFGAVLLTLRP